MKESLAAYFTFEASKNLPTHRWLYYKEAYSPQIVQHFISYFNATESVFDPFAGIGTTPLTSKSLNLQSTGIDISPLAVFTSRTKCEDYSPQDIEDAKKELKSLFKERKEPQFKWDFELFSPRRFFSKRAYNDICFIRERIEQMENEKVGSLFLLALLSSLPQTGFFIKDGGVLRLEKSKRAMPVKDAFKKKIKQIISDLETSPIEGPTPEIHLADARTYSEGNYEIFITSPPYLNNIDYSKVYGLELSLLSMEKNASLQMRKEALRSFITKDAKETQVPEEAGEIAKQIPIAGEYFADMERVLQNLYKITEKGGALIVGNAALQGEHIQVDEILGKIGERLGFEYEIPLWMERTADVKPAKLRVRESAVVFKK
ncbi:MAG: site-specific DNA-methyltransferase [bacterium]|nr:site-specific DNA-methyltransferase [bacterium]